MAFRLRIVAPGKVLVDEPAQAVTFVTGTGEMAVYPGHTRLAGTLQPGSVRVRFGGGTARIAVSGGFVLVGEDEVLIVARTAERSGEIDVDRARRAAERARARLREGGPDIDYERARAALARALARLEAAGAHGS